MSRCSLNLESNKRLDVFLQQSLRLGACAAPLGTAPWTSTHRDLAKVPTTWDIHPAVHAPGKGSFASESAPKSVTYSQKKDG